MLVVSVKLEKGIDLAGAAVSSVGHLERVIELRMGTEEASVVVQRVLLFVRILTRQTRRNRCVRFALGDSLTMTMVKL